LQEVIYANVDTSGTSISVCVKNLVEISQSVSEILLKMVLKMAKVIQLPISVASFSEDV